jgi:hypothetical protein
MTPTLEKRWGVLRGERAFFSPLSASAGPPREAYNKKKRNEQSECSVPGAGIEPA